MKARIESVEGSGLWLITEDENNPDQGAMYAITKEELEPIMNAIKKYLESAQDVRED